MAGDGGAKKEREGYQNLSKQCSEQGSLALVLSMKWVGLNWGWSQLTETGEYEEVAPLSSSFKLLGAPIGRT